jgi:pyruvate/2-oxoacid:ferredoxin oxidoreductase alpha subunit
MEQHNRHLQKKYSEIADNEVRFEEIETEDADIIMIGYGIVSRILETVVTEARKEGYKVGFLRPVTLWPFPAKRIQELAEQTRLFFVSELSNGQMVDDVRLALEGTVPVHFYGRMGGSVPETAELYNELKTQFKLLEQTSNVSAFTKTEPVKFN